MRLQSLGLVWQEPCAFAPQLPAGVRQNSLDAQVFAGVPQPLTGGHKIFVQETCPPLHVHLLHPSVARKVSPSL